MKEVNLKTEWVEYQLDGKNFRGYLAYNENTTKPRPTVVVAHAWMGQDAFARQKAELLAELGYVGFAVDIYGDGKCVNSSEDAATLMMPLFIDRDTLRKRIVAGYKTAGEQMMADPAKMGAIGFCFGGLSVIELLRSGVFLKGVVSFHGLLGNALGSTKAHAVPAAQKLHGSLLILHGHKDPLVSKEDIDLAQKEFTKAEIDWQMHIYGKATHAFTNPAADDPESGMMYHPKSEQRALLTMKNFFAEVFD